MPPIFTSAVLTDGASVLFEAGGIESDAANESAATGYGLPRFPFDGGSSSIEESLAERLLQHLGVQVVEQEFVDTLYEREPDGSELKLNNLQLVTAWEGTPPERSASGKRLVWVPLAALATLDLSDDLRAALLATFGLDAGPRRGGDGTAAPGRLIVVTGPAGVGKSTVARLLASSLQKAALIEIDYLSHMAISGGPLPRWEGGDIEQSHAFELLALRNAAGLARNFSQAGYDAVIEGVLEQTDGLDTLLDESGTQEAYFVSLLPSRDALRRRDDGRPADHQMGERSVDLHQVVGFNGEIRGLHIDSTSLTAAETAELVLEHLDEARVR